MKNATLVVSLLLAISSPAVCQTSSLEQIDIANQFLSALRRTDTAAAEALWEKHDFLKKVCDNNGDTLLHAAAARSNLAATKFLLTKGLDPNGLNNKKQTPLIALLEKTMKAVAGYYFNAFKTTDIIAIIGLLRQCGATVPFDVAMLFKTPIRDALV